jgi:hypothetical protein
MNRFGLLFTSMRLAYGKPPPEGDGKHNRKALRDMIRAGKLRNDGTPKEGA